MTGPPFLTAYSLFGICILAKPSEVQNKKLNQSYMDAQARSYEWEVNLVKDRFMYLDLDFEQAAQIHAFEKEPPLFESDIYFSDWETYDYEWYRMSRILREDQLKKYEAHIDEAMVRHEQGLREVDARKANYLLFRQHVLAYIQENHDLGLQDELLTRNHLMMGVRTKLNYLKAEYSSYLKIQREKLLTNHFRLYRRTSPIELEVQLLLLDEKHIWPDYFGFKDSVDAVTLEMMNLLINRFRHMPKEWLNNAKAKQENAYKYFRGLSNDLMEPTANTYYVSVRQNEQEIDRSLLFFLIMVDAKQYGRQPRQ
jgi:hypothetical protein